MNRSTAQKYSRLLKVLSEPEYLMILDMLIDRDEFTSTNDMAEATNLTERKVINYCENLQSLSLVSQDNKDGITYYKFSNSSNARDIEIIWRKLF
jgi:Mn-dependent DtxR family transcriptional regulator